MKLRILQSIENGNYVFIFSIVPGSISSNDTDAFQKYGDQLVNFGGTFVDGETTFVLPNEYHTLPSDFPVKITISATGSSPFVTNTAGRLTAYSTTVTANITDAIAALRALSDTFTGEFIVNI